MVIQLCRTPVSREFTYKEGYKSCKKVIEQLKLLIKDSENELLVREINRVIKEFKYTKDFAKSTHLIATTDDERINRMADIFANNRIWFVYENKHYVEFPFITSDNPVVLYNPINKKFGIGPNGIDVKYTITSFPLTPRYLIYTLHKESPIGIFSKDLTDYLEPIDDMKIISRLNLFQVIQCYRQIYLSFDFAEELQKEFL